MNKLKYFTAILIAVAGLGFQQAQAHLLDPYQFQVTLPNYNPDTELNYLQNHGGGSYTPTFQSATSQFLGKFDRNNDNSKTVTDGAISINTYVNITFSNNVATISWNLTGSGFTLDGVLIKDGHVSTGPGGQDQLFRFYGVSTDENLIGSGTVTFDDPIKNISHIAFFGSPGGSVPDGGSTVMLLGAALGSLGMARRFLKK